jgi:hypothetical protein
MVAPKVRLSLFRINSGAAAGWSSRQILGARQARRTPQELRARIAFA